MAVSALDRPQSTAHYALGTRLAGTLASFAGSVLIVILLSPDRIGIFLTVGSLAAFSAILDLGVNYSFLLATAAHGEKEALDLIAAATAAIIPASALSSLILFVGGAIFLSQVGLSASLWLAPWACYCAIIGPLQVLMLRVTYIEGTGRRDAAWRAHFYIEVVAGIGLLIAIALRIELWAFATAALFRVVMILVLLRKVFWLPRSNALSSPIRARLALWRREIWPMQWKNLSNNLAGLLTTRLLTPILLAAQGAATAGRVGLALSISLTIVGITSAWPMSQTALYAGLYQHRRIEDLFRVLRATFWRSWLLAIAMSITAFLACEILRARSTHVADRLPEPSVLWPVLAAAAVAHIAYAFAIYIRARRTDPVVWANLVFAIPTLVAYAVSAVAGPLPFAWTYLLAAAFFSTLYGYYFLRFCRALSNDSKLPVV